MQLTLHIRQGGEFNHFFVIASSRLLCRREVVVTDQLKKKVTGIAVTDQLTTVNTVVTDLHAHRDWSHEPTGDK